MGDAPIQHTPAHADLARDDRVRRVVAEWRRLTGGAGVRDAERATLVACSGGADSSALAIALATTPARTALGHIVHDLRPESQSLADRDAVRTLADRLGLEFLEASISVKGRSGNAEAAARVARYEALATLAPAARCRFIATAHHADDQLETVLMNLLRGAGPGGLAGIAPTRPLGGTTLIRPMLVADRDDAEAVCLAAGWPWREDLTNLDTTRTRAALRHTVVPRLKTIRPDAARRVATSAQTCREVAASIRTIARRLDRAARTEADARTTAWRRDTLRRAPPGLVGELLRSTHQTLLGATGRDKLTRTAIARATGLIRDEIGAERRLNLGRASIIVTRDSVRMEASNV